MRGFDFFNTTFTSYIRQLSDLTTNLFRQAYIFTVRLFTVQVIQTQNVSHCSIQFQIIAVAARNMKKKLRSYRLTVGSEVNKTDAYAKR
jgi:hypothetical protein